MLLRFGSSDVALLSSPEAVEDPALSVGIDESL